MKYTKKVLIFVLTTALILPQALGIVQAKEKAEASVMRLAAVEGTVAVESQSGKDMPVLANMRLYSGDQVATEQASYAYMSLDDAKSVKLDALSRAQVRKSGKKLELLLDSGNLFFDVTQPLEEEESLNIRTSTMVTGIRGTAGVVSALDEGVTMLYILDGSVRLSAKDPVTGETRIQEVKAGQKAVIAVHRDEAGGEFVEIYISRLTEEDIRGFVAMEIAINERLRQSILNQTDLDVGYIVRGAVERVAADEREIAAWLEALEKNLTGQENAVVIESAFTDKGGGNSGKKGGSSGQETGTDLPESSGEFVLDETMMDQGNISQQIAEAFEKYDRVVLSDRVGTDMGVRLMDGDLEIPLNKTLVIKTAINMTGTVTVNGTLEAAGNVISSGTVINNGVHTFHIPANGYFINSGVFRNQGRLLIDKKGNFISEEAIADNGVSSEPSFINAGEIVNNGWFQPVALFGSSASKGSFQNKETGVIENHGVFQMSPDSARFIPGTASQWQGQDGIYSMSSGDGSPQQLEGFCAARIGAVKCIMDEGNSLYAAGADMQRLLDEFVNGYVRLIGDMTLTEDLVLKGEGYLDLSLNGYTLTLDGARIKVLSDANLTGGSIRGINTECVIENRSTDLTLQNIGVRLETKPAGAGNTFAILNSGGIRFLYGEGQITAVNDTENGWAIANTGGTLANNGGSAVDITLTAKSQGYTINLLDSDRFSGSSPISPAAEYRRSDGNWERLLSIPSGSKLRPTASLDTPSVAAVSVLPEVLSLIPGLPDETSSEEQIMEETETQTNTLETERESITETETETEGAAETENMTEPEMETETETVVETQTGTEVE